MKLSDIPPALFTITAEILGVLISESLRLNQQNSVGNWFELVGQVIETYNGQQQLRQQGPGALPGSGFNTSLAKQSANEPLANFAHLLHSEALSQPDVQQELLSETSSSNSSSSGSSSQSQSALMPDVPMMLMPSSGPSSQDLELLKQQVDSLTEEVMQLKELVISILSCMK